MARALPHHRTVRFGPTAVALCVVAGLSLLAGACTSGDGDATEAVPTSTTTAPSTTTTADPRPGLQGISVRLESVITGGLTSPTAMVVRPGRNQMWITERSGRVRVATVNSTRSSNGETTQNGITLLDGAVLDVSATTSTDGERGLLGLAFSTDGRTLYVDHTDRDGDIVVAAYAVTDGRPFAGPGTPPPVASVVTVDPASRVELLSIDHKKNSNHNGGQLVLGPDGYLYIGVGDGGGSGDPDGNAQNKDSLLGKILRIDPAGASAGQPYASPPDNPFVGGGGRPEIHLFGVRNPWRFSFDRETGALWVADVGQGQVEEIDRLPADIQQGRGANLGWNWFEGDQRFKLNGTPPRTVVEPLHTYDHSGGRCSITGGYVYRGTKISKITKTDNSPAVYVYGDYCTGEIRGLKSEDGVVIDDRAIGTGPGPNNLVSFAQDDQGELYVVSASGSILRIVG